MFEITITELGLQDIQNAIDFYDEQQPGLGKRFEKVLDDHFITLRNNPFFQIRYDIVRCLPIKSFPFMIHFIVDEQEKNVKILAILHTSLNPRSWLNRPS